MLINRSRTLLLALASGLVAVAPGVLAQQSTPTPIQPAAPVKPVDATPVTKPVVIQPAAKPADAKPADAKMPTGKEVFAKYLDAVGTAKAREAIKCRVATGTIKIEAQGIEGKFVIKTSGDGKMINTVDLGDMGEVVRWTDGKTAAEVQPGAQARVISGEDLLDAQRSATLFPEATPDLFFKTIDVTGVEMIDGKECTKVETTSPSGGKRSWFYAKDTGLLVKWSSVKKRGDMEVKVETVLSDWKEFDGVKVAMAQTQTSQFGEMTLGIVIRTEKIEHNTALKDADFAVPESLKEVVAEQKTPAKDGKEGGGK